MGTENRKTEFNRGQRVRVAANARAAGFQPGKKVSALGTVGRVFIANEAYVGYFGPNGSLSQDPNITVGTEMVSVLRDRDIANHVYCAKDISLAPSG